MTISRYLKRKSVKASDVAKSAAVGGLGGVTVAGIEHLLYNLTVQKLGGQKVVALGDFVIHGLVGAGEGALIKAARPQTSNKAIYAASVVTNTGVAGLIWAWPVKSETSA